MNQDNLYNQVRNRENLRKAWLKVRSNGKSSKSRVTRLEITEFDKRSDNYLQNIARKLSENRFKFGESLGVPIPKGKGSGYRPIVISPVENRIVQRAILDVLQDYEPIGKFISSATSFGGIKDRGVADAISEVYEFIDAGKGLHFLRTDIKSFFTRIPKNLVMDIVKSETEDQRFLALFEAAIVTELSNLEKLGKRRDLFPIHDLGVAQGSCLSPMMGNIVLSSFDGEMNSEDVLCIRYIDDFIILAPSYSVLRLYLGSEAQRNEKLL